MERIENICYIYTMKPLTALTLNLSQPLPYTEEKTLGEKPFDNAYQAIIQKLDREKSGCEAVLVFQYNLIDAADIDLVKIGFSQAPGEDVRIAVAEGKEIPLSPHDMEIISGKYKLSQLPFPPAKDDLFGMLMTFICDSNVSMQGTAYLRLLKETDLAILAQIILPLSASQLKE
jgi:hypothetical protein